jgi:fluoride exporter
VLLWVGIGGFLGAAVRYVVDGWVSTSVTSSFPYGTLVVNVTGSFLLGVLFAMTVDRAILPAEIRGPVLTGFVGAYTTFSTLMLESWRLAEDGAWLLATINLTASVGLGLAALVAGVALGRAI